MRLEGKVVRDHVGPRFSPDDNPEARLRLTGLPIQPPDGPEIQEIDLQKYFPWRMSFECQKVDGEWAWGVQEGSMRIHTDSP